MNKVSNKLNQSGQLITTAIVVTLVAIAATQRQKAVNLADDNAQLRRVVQHHVRTISAGRKENRELKGEKDSAIAALASAYEEILRLKTRKERLEQQVKKEIEGGKARQAAAEMTVAQLAVKNTQGAIPLLPAQVIAELIVANLAVQTLRAEQKAFVTQANAERALDKCARNQPGLQSSDKQIIGVFMRQAQKAASPEDMTTKAYNALAETLRKRGLAAARKHCRL